MSEKACPDTEQQRALGGLIVGTSRRPDCRSSQAAQHLLQWQLWDFRKDDGEPVAAAQAVAQNP